MKRSVNNHIPRIRSNEFLVSALEQIPRLLGQLNRNPSSSSCGSFDRAYWHYRTNDISSCRYQESVYTLALLFCSNFDGNKYYHDDKLFEWIRASLRFTASIQRRNGSFDEWYIHEGSYVGTAFLTAALGQTLSLLRENNSAPPEDALICRTIEKAASFLMKRQEKTVMNQVSGAVFAIASAASLLERPDLTLYAERLLDEFLSAQSGEGWWSEYGGPDIGYLSLTISYLEKYRELIGSKTPIDAIRRAKIFVETFINPDHTAGGEYMSRNTEYLIPSPALPYLGAVRPAHLDDRYLCYILYNWIETGLKIAPQPIKLFVGERYFPESSLLRVANDSYSLVVNGRKGGSFRLYAGNKVYYDSGCEFGRDRKRFSTGVLDTQNNVIFKGKCLSVSGRAKPIKEPLLRTGFAIIFKLWQIFFGNVSFLQKQVKGFLRTHMISYSKSTDISFERIIEHDSESVVITDSISGLASRNGIVLGTKAAYNAVPSSKYASVPELNAGILTPHTEESSENGVHTMKRIFQIESKRK